MDIKFIKKRVCLKIKAMIDRCSDLKDVASDVT